MGQRTAWNVPTHVHSLHGAMKCEPVVRSRLMTYRSSACRDGLVHEKAWIVITTSIHVYAWHPRLYHVFLFTPAIIAYPYQKRQTFKLVRHPLVSSVFFLLLYPTHGPGVHFVWAQE